MKRNLYYNCCALQASETEWRDNVRMLCRYADIFNGRRLVVVRTGEGLADPDEVERAFEQHTPRSTMGFEFLHLPNDPVLHETANFLDVLERLHSERSDEATFYAHTKGVRYYPVPEDAEVIAGIRYELLRVSIMQWRNRMYHECLNDPDKIDALLTRFAATGCYFHKETVEDKKLWTKWMFAGTFFWFNHERLFSKKDWRNMGPRLDRFSTENYLGIHFEPTEVHTLYGFDYIRRYNPYTSAVSVFRCPRCKKAFPAFLRQYRRVRCCRLAPPELLYHPQLADYPSPSRLVG